MTSRCSLTAALDRARATLVCAVVGKRQVKPAEQIAVRRVDCHAVKPGLLCAARREGKIPDDLLDILTGYLLRHTVTLGRLHRAGANTGRLVTVLDAAAPAWLICAITLQPFLWMVCTTFARPSTSLPRDSVFCAPPPALLAGRLISCKFRAVRQLLHSHDFSRKRHIYFCTRINA